MLALTNVDYSMSSTACCRFLRPTQQLKYRNLSAPRQSAYLQFYTAVRRFSKSVPEWSRSTSCDTRVVETKSRKPGYDSLEEPFLETGHNSQRDDVRRRIEELRAADALKYPRLQKVEFPMTCAEFREKYAGIKPEESREGDNCITLRGRLYSSRIAGSKLAFMDIMQNGFRVQGMCEWGRLEAAGVQADEFKRFCQLARRGDIVSFTGVPSRTKRGELSLLATKLPTILTPILASLPTVLEDPKARIYNRHADLLVNQKVADTLRLRSHIIQSLRDFLVKEKFLEVQTPVLADGAGGAIARPFVTEATEFSDKTLSLRIAPEIWLKRLVLGGMDRVFEIGPAFRNEGLDTSHNPEYTTCEFYQAFANIEDLIKRTEDIMNSIVGHANHMIQAQYTTLQTLDSDNYKRPFRRIEFVPALEASIQTKLPDLQSDEASEKLVSLYHDLHIPLPASPTLPRLLDKLSSIYLEPKCDKPTFIIHPPACLAPLSKSFHDPAINQVVSARAELFIQQREIANMYEEENSPFEQREKFMEQAQWRDDENVGVIDEAYVEALEWGLPPTGGWGCGIDRLCMHFAGASRISDVLSFGSLRNVVGLARRN